MFLYFQDVVIINGNGIFINPLHIKIQYSAVLVPPPALISHCDQENYSLTIYIEFYYTICKGSTMILLGRKKEQTQKLSAHYTLYYYYYYPQSSFFLVLSCVPYKHLFPIFTITFTVTFTFTFKFSFTFSPAIIFPRFSVYSPFTCLIPLLNAFFFHVS